MSVRNYRQLRKKLNNDELRNYRQFEVPSADILYVTLLEFKKFFTIQRVLETGAKCENVY